MYTLSMRLPSAIGKGKQGYVACLPRLGGMQAFSGSSDGAYAQLQLLSLPEDVLVGVKLRMPCMCTPPGK